MFARLCPAQAKDDQLQLTVLSCSAINSFSECVVERQWTSSSISGCYQSVPGTFSTKRRSRRTPQTPACSRLLWTASVDFTKCTALRASTLNRLAWDPRFSEVRVAGCKRHRYLHRVHTTRYTSNHLGVVNNIQQIRLCHTRTRSVVFTCSQFNNTTWCLMSAVSTWSMIRCLSSSRRLSHRRVRANAHHIVELAQTCISAFHLSCCTAVLRCVHRQQSIRQRAYHHVRSNGRRSPGMYARHRGRSF